MSDTTSQQDAGARNEGAGKGRTDRPLPGGRNIGPGRPRQPERKSKSLPQGGGAGRTGQRRSYRKGNKNKTPSAAKSRSRGR